MSERWYRWRQEIAGQVLHGLAFNSEAELEAFLAVRGVSAHTRPALPDPEVPTMPRSPGRPSHDRLIAAAVQALGKQLAGPQSLANRARIVLSYIARTHDDAEIPGSSTVERYLRQNSRQ